MNKLLSAEFIRLFKSKIFRICLLVSGILGAGFIIPKCVDVKRHAQVYANLSAEYSNADSMLFVGVMVVIFLMAMFVGLFAGTEYSDGTIRNKLIVGHRRGSIYLSKLVVCIVANVIFLVVCIFAAWGLGSLLLGTGMGYGQILTKTLMICVVTISMTALLLLCSMSIQSKSVGSVVCLMLMLGMLFVAAYVNQRLDAPEYYDGYAFSDNETGELIESPPTKNPSYLRGVKRDIYEFIYDFVPCGQIIQIGYTNTGNANLMMLYDMIILIGSTSAGIIIFKKKNLK